MSNAIEYGLFPVCHDSSFETILGYTGGTFTGRARRARWAQWIRLARARDDGPDVIDIWTAPDRICLECPKRKGLGWCGMMDLPCNVNPVFSFRTGGVGMACMGFLPHNHPDKIGSKDATNSPHTPDS